MSGEVRIRAVTTTNAPKAVAAYSQAVVADGVVYTSGQIGLDPATGELVPGGVEAQTRRVLDNIAAVLGAAGSGFDLVLKCTCFLADIDDFEAFNAIYAGYFGATPPARSAIGVAALPRGARIEIESVALLRAAGGGQGV